MILAFLVGSALALIGRVGEDLMSLVSFIFSAENFADANPLFVNELGEKGKNYINRCINGDGNIAEELNIDDSIGSLDSISSIESNISIVYNEFSNLILIFRDYQKILEDNPQAEDKPNSKIKSTIDSLMEKYEKVPFIIPYFALCIMHYAL